MYHCYGFKMSRCKTMLFFLLEIFTIYKSCNKFRSYTIQNDKIKTLSIVIKILIHVFYFLKR